MTNSTSLSFLNWKTDIFGLQIGTFHVRLFPDRWSRRMKTLGTRVTTGVIPYVGHAGEEVWYSDWTKGEWKEAHIGCFAFSKILSSKFYCVNIHTSPMEVFFIWTLLPPWNFQFSFMLFLINFGCWDPPPPRNFYWPSMGWVCIFSGNTHFLALEIKMSQFRSLSASLHEPW